MATAPTSLNLTMPSDRFVDMAPAEVWATLLDEGVTSVRSPRSTGCSARPGKPGNGAGRPPNPATVKPELVAYQPNSVWSWDITKLRGPAKWC